MRTLSALLAAGLLIGCGAKDADPATDATADSSAIATTSPYDAFAGTWNLTSTLEGVATPVPSSITGTSDVGSWTMKLEGRDPVMLEVAIRGDSLISESEQYESILRKGVMVQVRTAMALQDGMLMGTMVATYRKSGTADEKVNGTVHGVRAAP